MNPTVTLALVAGLVASVNPCGFALLPAYVSFFVGREEADAGDLDPARRVLRAVPVSLSVSAGFMVVFLLIGVVLRSVSSTVQEYAPWATIVIGLGLATLGVAMLAGFELASRLPRLDAGGRTRGIGSMFVFGVSYAVASLSCSIGPFIAVAVQAGQREDLATGVLAVTAYGLGMSLVLTALTLAVAVARESVVQLMRRGMRHVHQASAVLMVVIGGYVAWYGVFALRVQSDPGAAGGPVDRVERWSSQIESWVSDTGGGRVAVLLGLTIVAIVAGAVLVGSLRSRPTEPEPAPTPAADRPRTSPPTGVGA